MKVISQNTDTNYFSLLELPFWLSLSYWALFPDTSTLKLEILSIPVNIKDILLIAVACFYLLLTFTNYHRTINYRAWDWHCHLPILTIILLLYAVISIQISGMDASNSQAMTYTLILTASAFLLGYILLAKRSPESARSFLWRLTVYLAVLGLLYSAASLFSLGLGNVRADLNAAESDFGILRVRGPLFGSSTGHFILVPALAFGIQELIQSRTRRLFKFSVVMALTLTVIGLGSRAALLILCLFFLSLLLFMKNKKQAVIAAVIMIVVVSTSTMIFSAKGSSDRLNSFEDSARSDTYLTSFKIITHRNAELNITGSGYGSYWSWYLTDTDELQVSLFDGSPTVSVYPLGDLLYHPHSTFLLCIVELGIPGLIYFTNLWFILFKLILRNLQQTEFTILNNGIFASGFLMFFDFFIFKSWQINTIWWIYLFGALMLNFSTATVKHDRKSSIINQLKK